MNPGATTLPCASIFCFAGGAVQVPDGRNAPAANPHVAGVPGRTRPVDDVAMQNNHVEWFRGRLSTQGNLAQHSHSAK